MNSTGGRPILTEPQRHIGRREPKVALRQLGRQIVGALRRIRRLEHGRRCCTRSQNNFLPRVQPTRSTINRRRHIRELGRQHPNLRLELVHDRTCRRPLRPRRAVTRQGFFTVSRDIRNRRAMAWIAIHPTAAAAGCPPSPPRSAPADASGGGPIGPEPRGQFSGGADSSAGLGKWRASPTKGVRPAVAARAAPHHDAVRLRHQARTTCSAAETCAPPDTPPRRGAITMPIPTPTDQESADRIARAAKLIPSRKPRGRLPRSARAKPLIATRRTTTNNHSMVAEPR